MWSDLEREFDEVMNEWLVQDWCDQLDADARYWMFYDWLCGWCDLESIIDL